MKINVIIIALAFFIASSAVRAEVYVQDNLLAWNYDVASEEVIDGFYMFCNEGDAFAIDKTARTVPLGSLPTVATGSNECYLTAYKEVVPGEIAQSEESNSLPFAYLSNGIPAPDGVRILDSVPSGT